MDTKLFLDTNILFDQVDKDRPGHEIYYELEKLITHHSIETYCSWHSLSIFEYVMAKKAPGNLLELLLKELVNAHTIPKTGTEEAQKAFLYYDGDYEDYDGDYEDAMQISAAVAGNCDCIITSNSKDFSLAPISVYTCAEFIETFS